MHGLPGMSVAVKSDGESVVLGDFVPENYCLGASLLVYVSTENRGRNNTPAKIGGSVGVLFQ